MLPLNNRLTKEAQRPVMSILSRLFGLRGDPRDGLRPLWYRVVEISRLPEYYARCGVADTVEGRFDMVTQILSLVLLRMEDSRGMKRQAALLTELFVEDMDGQLRQTGVGDLMVGKHMGKLLSTLGGRLGALRDALGAEDDAALVAALERNVTFAGAADPQGLAARLRALHALLRQASDDAVLKGDFAR